MKYELMVLSLFLLNLFSCSGSGGDSVADINFSNISVESISLDQTELTLPLGALVELTATLSPEDATDQAVIWESSDSTVAAVAQDGSVIGMADGSATINATSDDGNFVASCTIQVTPKTIDLASVTNSPSEIKLCWSDPILADLACTRVTLADDSGTISTTDLAAGTLESSFTGLNADTEYTITLMLVTTSGDELPESVYSVQTPPAGNESLTGTPIESIAELQSMEMDKNYILMANLDLESADWTPIGSFTYNYETYSIDYTTAFTGKFDGAGHTIMGLEIDADSDNQGLFGYVSENGDKTLIRTLILKNSSIKSSADNAGTLAGNCTEGDGEGSIYIENCQITNTTITGNESTGGIIGKLSNGTLTLVSCSVDGSSSINGTNEIGGMVGEFYGQKLTVTNCHAETYVSGLIDVGGLFGSFSVDGEVEGISISNCSVNATLYGSEDIGGLFGYSNDVTATECYTEVTIIGGYNIGGLIGRAENATIEKCHAALLIDNVTATAQNVGGLVGDGRWLTITQSFAEPGINSDAINVGGLVGCADDCTIQNSYVSSSIWYDSSFDWGDCIHGSDYCGGLVGLNDSSSDLTIDNCYAYTVVGPLDGTFVNTMTGCNSGTITYTDSEENDFVYGYPASLGSETYDDYTTPQGTTYSTAQMTVKSNFTVLGWDFVGETANGTEEIWDIDSTINNGLPYLVGVTPAE